MHKLGLKSSLLAALFSFPLTSFALGLGEIEASSFLNQPLKAEIEVISARAGEIDDLLISLASRDAFEKAGLERPAELSRIRFKVEKSEDGQTARILVTTKDPVQEPFLSFLVEADWAKGRLVREFTVLLDPVSFAQQPVKPAPRVSQSSTVTQDAEPVASQPSTSEPARQESSAVASPIATTDEPSSERDIPFVADDAYLQNKTAPDQIVVSKGDTLWGIASQFKDDNHSMAQVMLAMQMTNPDAFYQDNINNLRVGAVLRVPDMDVMDKLSKQEAYAQVLDQNGLWDEYVARKSGATTTAVADASSGIESTQQESDSQLNLLTPDQGDSQSASLQNNANTENASQIRKQLALAEEELEAARLENEDLKSRIEMLEQQQQKFDELQKLVKIQDGSLAQLQQNVANEEVTNVTDQMGDQGKVDEQQVIPDQTEVTGEPAISEEKPSEVMINAADEMLADSEETDTLKTTEMDTATVQSQDEMQSTEAETVIETTQQNPPQEQMDAAEEKATVPVPVIVTQGPETGEQGSWMDMLPSMQKLLGDPVMLGGIGAILALLLGLVFLKRKKSSDDESGITLDETDDLLDDDATPIHVPSNTQFSVDEEDTDDKEKQIDTAVINPEENLVETVVSEVDTDVEEDEFSKTAIISDEDRQQTTELTEALKVDQDDVLNEADVYLAYGLYDNAEGLLVEALQNNPDRADYRAKLLDTHFATKNTDAFVREAEILHSMGNPANRFWDRIQIMGYELSPENELFSGARDSDVSVEDLEYAKPDSADFDISASDDISDFSNTDFNLSDDAFETAELELPDIASDQGFSETQDLDSFENLDVEFPDLDEEPDSADVEPEDTMLDGLELDSEDSQSEMGLIDETDDDEQNTGAEFDNISDDFDISDDNDDDQDVLNFDLPDDLDLSSDEDAEMIELEPTVEAPPSLNKVPPLDEDGVELELSASEVDMDIEEVKEPDFPQMDEDFTQLEEDNLDSGTVVMTAGEVEAAATVVDPPEIEDLEAEVPLDDELDFDMSHMEDAELQSGQFTPSETVALASVERGDDDITEFNPADITGEIKAFTSENTDEIASAEVDSGAGLDKTGTFAPGDFIEEESEDQVDSIEDITGIEDLMLPDDVDEVSTKLDLAKAFIDMGDAEGARSSLEEVLSEGTEEQKAEATGLMEQIK